MLPSTLGHDSFAPADEAGAFADPLWTRLRGEAGEAFARAPLLAPLFLDSILGQASFEAAVFHRVAARLRNDVVSLWLIVQAFHRAQAADPAIGAALRADIQAVLDHDPACRRIVEPFLYFKGFHAIQAHRLANWLWHHGERDFALYLQSRSSEVFQTDIHPAARFGRGIFLDHATGLVVGATAEIDDDVSLLQNITIGSIGRSAGGRDPRLRRGAMIGAGAKILGSIEVGENARVAASSVVLEAVPPYATVAGVPARVVRRGGPHDPARSVSEILGDLSYVSFDWTI
jgi:serine O-acetyltransferase